MRRSHFLLLAAPLLGACAFAAPDLGDAVLVPVPRRDQNAAVADFMQDRANAAIPECNTVHGKLIGWDSEGAGDVRVTLRTESDSTSAMPDDRGEFRLRAPSPGATVLVIMGAGIDSIALPELQRFRGHAMTVELAAQESETALLTIGRVYTHSTGCAGPPEDR
jgi:hypothetical protein